MNTTLQNKIEEAKKRIDELKLKIEWREKPEITDILQKISDEAWKKQKPRIELLLEQELTSIATLAQEEKEKEIAERIYNELLPTGNFDAFYLVTKISEFYKSLSNNTQL